MTDPRVVEALGGLPSMSAWDAYVSEPSHEDARVRALIATDLPSIVRATVPHWDEELKREVLRTLLADAALRIYGWPDGNADALCLAVPLVSVTCNDPLTGAVRCDALLSLLAPAPEADNGSL